MENNGNLFDKVAGQPQMPAQNQAMVGFVLGIISVALLALNFLIPELSLPGGMFVGIFGIIFSAIAKKQGNNSGIRKAGLTLSIIGVVLQSLGFVFLLGCGACVACVGCAALL